MEKTIFSKKHALIKLSLVILLILFAFSFAMVQAVGHSYYAKADELTDTAYAFTFDGGNYNQGTFLRVRSIEEYPVFTLTFNNKSKLAEKAFWYGESDSTDVSTVQRWELVDNYDVNTGVGTIYTNVIVQSFADANGGIYKKNIFFRSGEVSGEGEFYYYDGCVDLRIDNNSNDEVYAIDSLTAKYTTGNKENDYKASETNKNWISTPITVTVTNGKDKNNPNAVGGQYDNANFYYQLEGTDENGNPYNPVLFKKIAITQEGSDVSAYKAQAIIPDPESGIESYEGKVTIYSTSFASPTERIVYGEDLYLYYDGAEPTFEVEAFVGGKPYSNDTWTNDDITYVITNKNVASGATYRCKVTVNGQEQTYDIQKHGEQYSYTVSTEGTTMLQFSSVSGSGMESSAQSGMTARIDKVRPSLNVSATDKQGAEIRTMGTEPGNYRVGYAQDEIVFLLTNNSKQQQGNKTTYTYSLDGEKYQELVDVNGNYQLTLTNSKENLLVDKTYYFKLTTASGYEDQFEFTASILNSAYSVGVEMDELHPNGGWLKDAINVTFTLPKILGIENEYEIRGMITGAPDTVQVLEIEDVSSEDQTLPENKIKYRVKINTNLNNNSYTFEIYDKAQNKGVFSTEVDGTIIKEEYYRTTQLKLDLTMPTAVISRHINGTTIELASDDSWSAGEVRITITPEELISGVNCYPYLDGRRSNVPMEIINGAFSKVVSVGGLYEFDLVSGAGHTKKISCQVNIDTREIDFTGINVSTIDENGNIIAENIDVDDPSLMIANNLKVTFGTNHNYLPISGEKKPHFNFYYAPFEGDEPTIELSQYTLFVPQEGEDPFSFIIRLDAEEDQGYKKYSFFLTSMAIDANENVTRTELKYFSVKYDIHDFAIEVEYEYQDVGDEQWIFDVPRFILRLDSNISSDVKVNIDKYQYRLDGGEWTTISGTVSNSVTFDFAGVVQKVEGIDDMYSLDENTYSSYNGTIYFRALNQAGHASPTLQWDIKMDTSTPNPLYAVRQIAGENIYEDGVYTIYSNQNVSYVQTGASSAIPVFKNQQKAPITYYYRRIVSEDPAKDNDSQEDTLLENPEWRKLTEDVTFVSGEYYWLVADNGVHRSQAYKIHVLVEPKDPPLSATLYGGTVGADDKKHEYNWTQDRVEIGFTIKSASAVYIWYSFDGNEWEKVDEKTVEVIAGKTKHHSIYFVAPPADGSEIEEDFVIVGNIKNTVWFKVTNLFGSEFVVEECAVVRIDSETPKFNTNLSTVSGPVDETELTRYFSETIHIEIVADAYNPGGVEYTYKVEGATNYEKMAGLRITTDEILGYDGNGTLNLILRAQALASLKTYEKRLIIKIDKVAPDFELKGEVYKNGMSTGEKITSGTWINADEILVSRVVKNVPVSGVTYTVSTTNDPIKTWDEGTPISVKEISTVYVTATSNSGLVVKKEFQVNIDNQAPIINAGPIVNNEEDPQSPYVYYIDQEIRYEEAYLKSAMYNGFPLPNGHVIATNTVDNSKEGPDGKPGFVHIVVEDLAGNKTELRFYMRPFDLNVNNIEINDDHIELLTKFEAAFEDALSKGAFHENSRVEYFRTTIGRLWDRLATLEKEVADYQAYLTLIEQRVSFDLVSDYPEMEEYLSHFISPDPLKLYPKWQQDKIREDVYESYYAKLVSEYSKLDAYMSVVRDLQKQVVALPATNIVEEGDYQDVIRVYNAYQSLSNDQKAVFKSTLYTKLVELKRICEVYLLQDEDTGISINGDHLVGESVGLMLEVVSYEPSTELFINAQKTLYETVSEGNPRKIISINKLGLTGYGSQYDTGEIKITLPIPSEGETDYTQYVYFAVYRLSADGTLSPVKNVMRDREGTSVSFTSNQLDTYVLATTANVVVRDEPEKIYGSVGGIEIDATLLTYITFAVVAMFVVFVIIILLVAIRRRKFLRAYNRDHKNALQRRGITRIPKGNAPPPSNPARPEERVGDTSAVYYYGKRRKK